MPSSRFRFSHTIVVTAAGLMLAGCGGGSGDNRSALTEAIFVNSEVQGLEYRQDGRTGLTDENGTFTYNPDGGPVTFFIGAVVLGEVTPPFDQPQRVTPLDLGGGPERAANIAQFLQSLDDNQNPLDGINLLPFSGGFPVDPGLQFHLPAGSFEPLLASVLQDIDTERSPRARGEVVAALEEGTGLAFSPSDFLERIYYFEVVASDSLSDRGAITFSDETFGAFHPLADFVDNGGEGLGEQFEWAIDGEGRLTLEFENRQETLQRLSRITRDGVTRLSASRGTSERVHLYQARGFEPALLSGRTFELDSNGQAGWIEFSGDGFGWFAFEGDPAMSFTWDLQPPFNFLLLNIDGTSEELVFLARFRDQPEDGFEAFYIDVKLRPDGSGDVTLESGEWVTFSPIVNVR